MRGGFLVLGGRGFLACPGMRRVQGGWPGTPRNSPIAIAITIAILIAIEKPFRINQTLI